MQIPSTQLNTAAAAALPIQNSRETAARMGASLAAPTTQGVEHVEQGSESQDRDANEQYVGGRGRSAHPLQPENAEPPAAPNDLLQLSAGDEEPPPLLDLRG